MSVFKGGWRPHDRRALAMAVLFGIVCVVYIALLLNLTVISKNKYLPATKTDGTNTYQIPSYAARGGIYDRNGVPLTTNETRYRLVFYYDQLLNDDTRGNRSIHEILSAMDVFDLSDKRTQDYFPIAGEYPNVTYTDEAKDRESVTYARLSRFIALMDLDKDITAQKLVSFIIRRFGISQDLYQGEQLMEIVRVRYDMEATQFSSVQPYAIASNITAEDRAKISEQGIYGLWIEQDDIRLYHYPGYASHILGRTGAIYAEDWPMYKELGYSMSDRVGITGCEKAFETYLRGKNGVVEIKEDKDGNIISMKTISEPKAGEDVYLTIDISLQVEAENALADNVNIIHGWTGSDECDAGSCVVLAPDTFEVLAIASYPTFNLSTFNEDYADLVQSAVSPFTNRATNGLYAPGSTFKVGMAVASVMEQATTHITKNALIDCTGKYTRFDDYQPTCWVYTSPTSPIHEHGNINVVQALEVSCNIFFYEAGYRLGIEKMNEYCSAFGLGSATGIEIGEREGTLAGPGCKTSTGEKVTNWNPGDTISAAIGQSYNEFTPIQLASYISTVVNGGTRYSTHLLSCVKAFRSDDASYVPEKEKLAEIALSDEARAVVKEGMKAVTQSSSTVSYLMAGVPVTVGSKTGTAQKTGFSDYAMFVCAAPNDNPSIVISVCMEKGSSGGYSAYTASRILQVYFKEHEVPEDGTQNENALPNHKEAEGGPVG